MNILAPSGAGVFEQLKQLHVLLKKVFIVSNKQVYWFWNSGIWGVQGIDWPLTTQPIFAKSRGFLENWIFQQPSLNLLIKKFSYIFFNDNK